MLRLSFILSALMATLVSPPSVSIVDTDGKPWTLFAPASHELELLFFVAADCPISNRYAPEIARICDDYRSRGVRCFLVYPDALVDHAAVSAHRREYALAAAGPAIIDRDHRLVRAVGPRVTPEAAIYGPGGLVYRGRIDDWYVDVGRSRRQASHHDVRLALDAAIAGRAVTQSVTEAVGCFIADP